MMKKKAQYQNMLRTINLKASQQILIALQILIAKQIGQRKICPQENRESTNSNEGDLNESYSGENEMDKSISASQLNTISDFQRTVSNENGSMVVLGNPGRFKRYELELNSLNIAL